MKWIDGLNYEEKKKQDRTKYVEKLLEKTKWHKWFAWYPVVIGETKNKHLIKVWLQYVYRRGVSHSELSTMKQWIESWGGYKPEIYYWQYSTEKPVDEE